MTTVARARREPPRFLRAQVVRAERVSARFVRVVVSGPELAGFDVPEPAASVRVLFPGPNGLPALRWNGNEFLLPDGSRPPIRTFTPWKLDTDGLTLGVVLHGAGVASSWAERAGPGDEVAVSGPGRGYRIDETADRYILLGDETAVPALDQLRTLLAVPVETHVEVVDAEPLPPLGGPVMWHAAEPGAPPGSTLLDALRSAELDPGTRVWAAGEAAAVQRLRRHLFDERGVPRSHTSIRGYWQAGRAAADDG